MQTPHQRELLALAFSRDIGANNMGALRDSIAGAVGVAGRVISTSQGVIVLLCSVTGKQDRVAVAECLRTRVAGSLGEERVWTGLARVSPSTTGAHLAALQARQALLLGRSLNRHGCTTAFDDLGPFRFILGRPRPHIRDFCEMVLGALVQGDEEHEGLIQTVEVWLRSRCNVTTVARELQLHRNTVRQRLQRFARLTGANLDDPDARLAVHMAILGKRALACLGETEWHARAPQVAGSAYG